MRLAFRLTGRHYYTQSGVVKSMHVMKRKRASRGLAAFDAEASRWSLRCSDPQQVLGHLRTLNAHAERRTVHAQLRSTKAWKLRNKAGKDRVLDAFWSRVKRTLSREVGPDLVRRECAVAWGAAKVKPDGNGTLTVPTCRVYERATQHFARVVLTDEFRTSKTCSACHGEAFAVRVVMNATTTRRVLARASLAYNIRNGFVRGWSARRLLDRAAKGKAIRPFCAWKLRTMATWRVDGHAGETASVKREKKRKREGDTGSEWYVRYARGLRFCQGCQKLWDRDANACDNIFKIAESDCAGCRRPAAFDRKVQTRSGG